MFNVHERGWKVKAPLLVIALVAMARDGQAAPLPYRAATGAPDGAASPESGGAPGGTAPVAPATMDSAPAAEPEGDAATTADAAPPAQDFQQFPAVQESARPAPSAWGLIASLGFRSDLVRGSGLDPFSESDGVPQSALSLAYRLGNNEMSSPLIGLEWDHGETTATDRGAQAGLTVDRLSATLEGRMAVAPKLSAFLRVAPGLMRHRATFYDPSAPSPPYGDAIPASLQQTTWVPAGDLSGGLAFRIGETRTQASHLFAFWVVGEGGYGYAGAHDVALSAANEPAPGRTDEPLRLGQLAFHGMFLRLRLALSF